MKIPTKIRWVCVALVLGALLVGGIALRNSTPSYPELKSSCDEALSRSPRSETLEAWLNANQIAYRQQPGPFEDSGKGHLVASGISSAAANRAATCIRFGGLDVRGGFLSRHVAYGCFVFSEDGSLIEYSIHDIYYGM